MKTVAMLNCPGTITYLMTTGQVILVTVPQRNKILMEEERKMLCVYSSLKDRIPCSFFLSCWKDAQFLIFESLVHFN